MKLKQREAALRAIKQQRQTTVILVSLMAGGTGKHFVSA
jgi:hypothetical protein